MIYICTACKTVATLPCTLLRGACDILVESCECIRKCLGPIRDGPLGFWVITTWAIMIIVMILAALGATGGGCGKAKLASLIILGLGLLTALFMLYMQRRIVHKVGQTSGDLKDSKEIAKQAMDIAKYDVGFCLYFFVFLGKVGYSCYAFSVLGCGNGAGMGANIVLLMHSMISPCVVCSWYSGQLVSSKVPKKNAKKQAQDIENKDSKVAAGQPAAKKGKGFLGGIIGKPAAKAKAAPAPAVQQSARVSGTE